MRLLLVEDDAAIARGVTAALQGAGFVVDLAQDGETAWAMGGDEDYDAVILDLGLPRLDGLSVLRRWRSDERVFPIIILSARGGWTEKVEGIEAGADDYLAKPFEPQELLLRTEAILRRTGVRATGPRKIRLGVFEFDIDRSELTREDALVRLTESEAQLLRLLAQNAHAAVDRLDLARDTADSTGRAVDVQVTRLRRKIETDPRNPRYLQTVRGVGYMLSPDE